MSYTAAIALSVSATVLAGVLAIAGFISYKRRQTAKTVQAASLKEVLMPHETIPHTTEGFYFLNVNKLTFERKENHYSEMLQILSFYR